LARKRDVDDVLAQGPLQRSTLEALAAVLDRRLQQNAQPVQPLTGVAVANLAQRLLQLALATEIPNTRVVELVERSGTRNRPERLVLELLRVHRATVSPGSGRSFGRSARRFVRVSGPASRLRSWRLRRSRPPPRCEHKKDRATHV